MSEATGDTGERRATQTEPAKPSMTAPSESEQRASQAEPLGTPEPGVVWVRVTPSQVVRTMVVALLTAAVVLGALYLLWQVRAIIGWCVLAVFLAVVLNPAVNCSSAVGYRAASASCRPTWGW